MLAGGLFLLGLALGFTGAAFPLLALALTADVGRLGQALLFGSLGSIIASAVSTVSGSPARRLLLLLAGPATAAGILSLGMLYDATPARYSLMAICAGSALIGAAVSRAWSELALGGCRDSLLSLAAAALCAGALGSATFAWLAAPYLQLRTSAAVMAGIVLAVSFWLWTTAGNTQISKVAPSASRISATGMLFSLTLMLQTSAYSILGLWLPFYLARQLGLSSTSAIGVLVMFWLAASVGRLLAIWSPRAKRFVPLLAASALVGGLGCFFLYFTVLPSGAAAGAALAGAALGALHAPTFRFAPTARDAIGPAFLASLVLGPTAAGVAGALAGIQGIALFIWTALGLFFGIPALIGVGALESRLSASSQNKPGTP